MQDEYLFLDEKLSSIRLIQTFEKGNYIRQLLKWYSEKKQELF